MRPFYFAVALVMLGAGLAGWVAMGQAGPGTKGKAPPSTKEPSPGLRPSPKPKPADDLFDVPLPPKSLGRDSEPMTDPVRVLDPIDIPNVPTNDLPPLKPVPAKEPARTDVKPTVFIPSTDGDAGPKPAPTTPAITKQEPAISLEWHGPKTLQVGAPAEYVLVARNTSAIPLQKVIVQVKVPNGVKVMGAEPRAEGSGSILMWEHGTMAPREDKVVRMTLVPPSKGEIACQAWVTFTGSTVMKAQVREPKLSIAAKAPDKVAIGELTTVVFYVSNPGDHPAEGVKLAISLGAGLECERGPRAIVDLNTIPAGETREVKVPCIARIAGPQRCEATAEGLGGLKTSTAAGLTVIQPKLDVQVAGPKLRYLDRKAVYTVKLTNTGDATASGVVLTHYVPDGFKYLAADVSAKHDPETRTLSWEVGEIGPGQGLEVKCELMAVGAGDFTHKIIASGSRGAKAETSVATKVEGLSALAMEVADSDDPVEVGTDVTFEIRVANTGSKDETDVKLVCAIPTQMKFKGARGPGKYEVVGNEVVFDVLKNLPARTEATFKVTLTAASKGDARFKATLTAGGLSEPVIRQESTRVYSD
jgi:uncharacterized repeat protein (TIGR01451 family)